MLQNYLKIALRQLRKHKLFSALNIFGLATSMSVCMLLIMILVDQYGYDDFHEKGDRIHRIISAQEEKGISIKEPTRATTSLPLAEKLKAGYPFVENTCRIADMGATFLVDGRVKEYEGNGFVVDESFLDMFTFGWQKGDETTALQEPRSLVLTEELAAQLFDGEDVMGRSIEIGGLGFFTVTGIMPDPPIRSHIYFDYLISFSTVDAMTDAERELVNIQDDPYSTWRGLVYVLLENENDSDKFDDALAGLTADYKNMDKKNSYLFQSQSLGDVLPSRDLSNDIGAGTPKVVLYFLMALGFLIMLAACFNYMNLSVARSLKRAKEIGIRKVIGAQKKDVIFQFLGEAVLISFFSFLLALGILELLTPAFYGLDPFVKEVFYLKKTPGVYLLFFIFSLFVGLIAGVFPAFNISKFQPIQAIQQLSNIKLFSRVGIRKALITVQFTLSLIFILTVIIVLKQQEHVLNADIGVNVKNMMNVWMKDQVNYDVFTQRVKQLKGVEDVSGSRHAVLLGGYSTAQVYFNGQKDSMDLCLNPVSPNYINQLEIELITGKNFTENKSSNFYSILINETAVKRMGYENANDALGHVISVFDTVTMTVIGVVKDFQHSNLWFDEIQPYALTNSSDYQHMANIHLTGIDGKETIEAVHNIWKELSPQESISAFFTDTRAYFMKKFFRMGSGIIGFVGFLTILISCLGLLGMVIYTIEGRMKEVGIRKILGASEGNVIWQLSKGFFLLLGIAILIATPLVYMAGNMWLQFFVMRINIGPQIIFIGVGIMLMLGLLTVVSQTFLAARANPVETLRSE